MGGLIEALRVLEIQAQRHCSQEQYQIYIAKWVQEGWPWKCCCWVLNTHLSCGHEWPQTLNTAAGPAALLHQELDLIAMASTARGALSQCFLTCVFSPLVKDQSRCSWWVEARSHAHTLAARGIGKVSWGHFWLQWWQMSLSPIKNP